MPERILATTPVAVSFTGRHLGAHNNISAEADGIQLCDVPFGQSTLCQYGAGKFGQSPLPALNPSSTQAPHKTPSHDLRHCTRSCTEHIVLSFSWSRSVCGLSGNQTSSASSHRASFITRHCGARSPTWTRRGPGCAILLVRFRVQASRSEHEGQPINVQRWNKEPPIPVHFIASIELSQNHFLKMK